jgi:hypothetical protein
MLKTVKFQKLGTPKLEIFCVVGRNSPESLFERGKISRFFVGSLVEISLEIDLSREADLEKLMLDEPYFYSV